MSNKKLAAISARASISHGQLQDGRQGDMIRLQIGSPGPCSGAEWASCEPRSRQCPVKGKSS